MKEDNRIERDEQEIITIGLVTLNKKCTYRKIQSWMIASSIYVFQKSALAFYYNSFYQLNWNQVFSYIQEAKFTSMKILKINVQTKFTSLFVPAYSQLQSITIQNCAITNLEGISQMKMDILKQLKIADNWITRTKALDKTNWPNIQKVAILEKILVEFNANRMNFNSNVTQIHIQSEQVKEDISVFVKVSFRKLKNLSFSFYIDQDLVIEAMQRKFQVEEDLEQQNQ